jgi:L-alanine-DL-glutamate epimerase-like enolase superfamily enzyme
VDAPQTPTDFTLWIDAPERMAARAAAIQAGEIGYSALKLKVGLGGEEELLRSVRDAYSGPLRLDANCGWTLQRAMELLPFMERYGVELVEQPFPAGRLGEVSALASATEIPIVADEDCVVFDDIERVAGTYDGVNLKVVKIGGLGPLLRGLRRAEGLGLRRMFGCMTETRLGIAGCAAISGATEFADLDGPIDLLNDPWEGLHLSREARWTHATSAIGSGVTIDPGVAGFERS